MKPSELEKWANVHSDVTIIEEFLDHICNNGYAIHKFRKEASAFGLPAKLDAITQYERRKLLEDFYDIDAEKLELERRQLLKEAV